MTFAFRTVQHPASGTGFQPVEEADERPEACHPPAPASLKPKPTNPIPTPKTRAKILCVIPSWITKDILLPFACTRIAMLAIGWFAFTTMPDARGPGWDRPSAFQAINMWSHFDGEWYLSIARDGYRFTPGQQSNIAFAPLFPMLMRFGGMFFGGSNTAMLISGIFVSNLSLIITLAYLSALMRLEGFDKQTARRAVWYVLIFPTTVFLSAVYPMSLFLALAVGAFYHARRAQWPAAGLLAGAAALARPDGILLGMALGVEWLMQWRIQSIERIIRSGMAVPAMIGDARSPNDFVNNDNPCSKSPDYGRDARATGSTFASLLLAPLCLLGWILYQCAKFHNPFAFITAQQAWDPSPLVTVLHSSRAPLQLGTAAIFIALTALSLRLPRISYFIFTTAMLAVMLWSNRYWSITRFVIVLFPAFMMLAILGAKWRAIHWLYITVASLLAMMLTMRFALNLWVA